MSLVVLFHVLCAQYVSDINISIIRSLRLCWWITTSVVLFSVRCMLQNGACNTGTIQTQPHQISNIQRTENKTTDVVIQQHSRKLLMMDILMSETCWVHKKWKKTESDIKLVFSSSTITMMHGPISIRFTFFKRFFCIYGSILIRKSIIIISYRTSAFAGCSCHVCASVNWECSIWSNRSFCSQFSSKRCPRL